MTVAELIAALSELPDYHEVRVMAETFAGDPEPRMINLQQHSDHSGPWVSL